MTSAGPYRPAEVILVEGDTSMHLRATGVRFAFLLALLIPALLMGQNNVTGAGTITGRVTDATGAIVTDATITITDTETNIALTVASNASGLYVLEGGEAGVLHLAAPDAPC